jgi:hypothetical protein
MQRSCSFDHLVGATEQRKQEGEAERPWRVLRDDDQLDFRGLLYQQVGGLLAVENPAGVAAGPAIGFGAVRTVGHEPPDAAALLSSPIH